MHDYRRVLAVVDFSDLGRAVARRALVLAAADGVNLAFLHLVAADVCMDGGYPAPSRHERARAYEQAALTRLAFLSATLSSRMPELLARCGHPKDDFADCVTNWRPDLVVAGHPAAYLDGRHDLLTLGRASSTGPGRLKRLLGGLISPVTYA
jgi:nucleotide-binding universal stress UspA family protein